MQNGFFGQILQRKVYNRKSKSPHRVLTIQNSLGTKFQLKLTILILWTKLTQKGYFQSKENKMKITIKLYIFELV